MGINQRLYQGVSLLVALTMAVGGFYMRQVRLEEPVFFPSIMDVRIPEKVDPLGGIPLNLGYFTNASDTRTVVGLSFLEAPDWVVAADAFDFSGGFPWAYEEKENVGHYSVRKVFLNIVGPPDPGDMEGKTLTKASVQWSDGSETTIVLGALHFYRDKGSEGVEFVTGSGSSDGTSTTRYRALENLELLSMEGPFLDWRSHRFELKVNGNDWRDVGGLSVEKNRALTFTSMFLPGEDLLEAYTRYNLSPELVFTREDGRVQSLRYHSLSSLYHSYTFWDLYRYAKERGEER